MRRANSILLFAVLVLLPCFGCQRASPPPIQSLPLTQAEPQPAAVPAPARTSNYSDELQGAWLALSSFHDGENLIAKKNGLETSERALFGDHTLTVTQVTVGQGTAIGVELKFTYNLDPSKSPKHLDLELLSEDQKIKVRMPAIYEMDGDIMRLAMANSEQMERPTRFSAEPGSQGWQMVLRRQKQGERTIFDAKK